MNVDSFISKPSQDTFTFNKKPHYFIKRVDSTGKIIQVDLCEQKTEEKDDDHCLRFSYWDADFKSVEQIYNLNWMTDFGLRSWDLPVAEQVDLIEFLFSYKILKPVFIGRVGSKKYLLDSKDIVCRFMPNSNKYTKTVTYSKE
jgi:hypothetical protein